jgi:hypothetical protein
MYALSNKRRHCSKIRSQLGTRQKQTNAPVFPKTDLSQKASRRTGCSLVRRAVCDAVPPDSTTTAAIDLRERKTVSDGNKRLATRTLFSGKIALQLAYQDISSVREPFPIKIL